MEDQIKAAAPEPDAETIEGWKSKYGDVYKLESDDDEAPLVVYCKKPSRQNISRYMKTIFQKDGVQAAHNFLIDTLIYPEKEKVAAVFNATPGVMISLCQALQETVGMNSHFLATKL
jgi:hypothetical protein